jgi:hypothetical protein
MAGGFKSASTPQNPDSLRPFSEAWQVVAANRPRAAQTGPLPRPLARGRSITWLGGKIQYRNRNLSRSRLELAREEVDRVFGDGHAAAHPELVVAIVHAASSDWAARVICAALEDIADAMIEGGVGRERTVPGQHSPVGRAVHRRIKLRALRKIAASPDLCESDA